MSATVVTLLTATYATCNLLRVFAYIPQIAAIARDRSGAAAISIGTWIFWSLSHGVTATYCALIAHDFLLAGMMWANAAGAGAVAALAIVKRRECSTRRQAAIARR